ncbi:hypothetical protein BDN72DRAFT_840326 [Pluteus cervinus]|uniref:Uncharacterized protein n=1 Tax=Pluteus cervinus TaxID=181527 RepID=A0ACD3AWW2_9AGAR|nr:hypothetical protein BDN72DRAFT_840326 [Pluteus cervinus]
MQAKFLSAIILVAVSLASAASAGNNVITEVYFCTGPNWIGTCTDSWLNAGYCYDIGDLVPGGVFASIGPNNQTTCSGYSDYLCNGNATWTFNFPGDSDGGAASGVPFGDLKTITCYHKE